MKKTQRDADGHDDERDADREAKPSTIRTAVVVTYGAGVSARPTGSRSTVDDSRSSSVTASPAGVGDTGTAQHQREAGERAVGDKACARASCRIKSCLTMPCVLASYHYLWARGNRASGVGACARARTWMASVGEHERLRDAWAGDKERRE